MENKHWLLECGMWREYDGEEVYEKDYILVYASSLDEAVEKARKKYTSGYSFYSKTIE